LARLLLVRHGETEWNKSGRYQGRSDIDLSAVGIKQVEALKKRLVKESIDAIYSSDLKRAVHTAQIIASGHNPELVICKELRELDFGEFEGLTFEEIEQRYPRSNWWTTQDPQEKLSNGESVSQLTDRVSPFASKLRGYTGEETVLIVAHGGSLRALICLLLGFGLEHWWQIRLDSASLTMVETYSDVVVLSLLNDLCHLENWETQGGLK
jgi:alpha-ribazole phosphatase